MAAAVRAPVTVTDARARAARAVERSMRDWAAGVGVDAVLEIPLHPPTEKSALGDLSRAIAWAGDWRAVGDEAGAIEIRWGERRWPSAGAQRVPERCLLSGADAISGFAGATHARSWRRLRARADGLRDRLGDSDALARTIRLHARTIESYRDDEFATLFDVVEWLVANPACGRRIRQLPIRGIDTKWLEARRAVVEALVAAVSGEASLGLVESQSLVRVRFLDPRLRPGGLTDVAAPVAQLAAMPVAPTTVFVFENLETVLSMPELPGAVVVHGSGYAVTRLGAIPWIRDGRIVYWGDLDSDGFRILDLLRAACHDVTSVLMDVPTLVEHADLRVPETRPASGEFTRLNSDERATLDRIRAEGGVRLEQERIPWGRALAALEAQVVDSGS